MTNRKTIDVLIIGAGPTGTVLAIDLARRGLNISIVDKTATRFQGSRAKGVQPRSLEVFQDLGVLDDVLNGGGDYPPLGIHLGPLVIPWRMMSKSPRTADVPFPNVLLIPQFRTDCALHDRLEGLGHTVDFNRELIDLVQNDEMVTATVSGPGGVEAINARYVVGADGGSSAVRRKLGINFAGATHEEDRMIVADIVTTGLSRNRWHIWPGRAGRFVGACPLPQSDLFQWMIRLAPHEQPDLGAAAINERIQKRTGDKRVELHDIQWTSVFRPNIRMAESYRSGRVFLAGDAAHVHTPAGAQGLNTGIQDAYNLGWKLAQVLAGADARLLDSYEAERLPIAANVLALSTKKYEGIAKLDTSSVRRGKDEKQLALSYFGGPLAPSGTDRTTTLRVGDRAPDAVLTGGDGVEVRLFETYRGPHFTAIAYGDGAALDLNRLDWPAVGVKLKRITIGGAASHAADYVLADAVHTFRRAYGVTQDTLFLIRPDGYIGHIATQNRLTTTLAAAARLTPAAKGSGMSANGHTSADTEADK
jgi:2-polyprenyl-6-methoxyphenol hydroxylase-like FAD-dependent oxidoreductase